MDDRQINIVPVFNYGYPWTCHNKIYCKGYAFADGNYLEGEALHDYFSDIKGQYEFSKKTAALNGCFSIVIEKDDLIYAAVDKIRMFPLFYLIRSGKIWLSDDAGTIANSAGLVPDKISVSEFLATGVVPGKYTLAKDVFQIPAGQCLYINKKNMEVRQEVFFTYATKEIRDIGYNNARDELIERFRKSFQRLFDSLENKQIAIPLSGGFDSRFIAVMCKELGMKNVVCFTFGKKNNIEAVYSERVARTLGYKWLFIEHTPRVVDSYFETETFKKYYPFVANYSSQFMMQQYFAVKYMKEQLNYDKDTVFLPGFAGDLLGGSHITKYNLMQNMSSVAVNKRLFRDQFNLIRPGYKYKDAIIQRISNTTMESAHKYIPYTVYEDWDMKEKLAKYLVNSSKVYSFFGFQYRLPFLDDELVDFFKKLPYGFKMNRLLYFDVLQNHFFKKHNVCFDQELQPDPVIFKRQYYKEIIKKYIPYCIKRLFYNEPDYSNYAYITSFMADDMKKNHIKFNSKARYYNSIIAQWYVNTLFIK